MNIYEIFGEYTCVFCSNSVVKKLNLSCWFFDIKINKCLMKFNICKSSICNCIIEPYPNCSRLFHTYTSLFKMELRTTHWLIYLGGLIVCLGSAQLRRLNFRWASSCKKDSLRFVYASYIIYGFVAGINSV